MVRNATSVLFSLNDVAIFPFQILLHVHEDPLVQRLHLQKVLPRPDQVLDGGGALQSAAEARDIPYPFEHVVEDAGHVKISF